MSLELTPAYSIYGKLLTSICNLVIYGSIWEDGDQIGRVYKIKIFLEEITG